MFNSLAAGRHLAARLTVAQLLAALFAGAAFLLMGPLAALSALVGGALVALGTLLMASRGLSQGRTGNVLARMLVGVLLRWMVILGGMYVVLARLEWPPVPLMAGLVLALLAPLFCNKRS